MGEELTGKVIRVSDGDTITLLLPDSKMQEKVRLAGIDAPESPQDFGQRARKFLQDFIGGETAKVEYDGRDQYGRIVGVVFVDGKNINLEMVKCGLAWHYVAFARNNTQLAEAQAEAQRKRRGLWVQPNPIPPWEFRREQRGKRNATSPKATAKQ